MRFYKLIFKLFLLINLIHSAHSYEDQLVLRGGISILSTKMKALKGKEDEFAGYGLVTSFGKRWKNWELNLNGKMFFGQMTDLTFQADGKIITGSGDTQVVSIGPVIKYRTNIELIKNWPFYIATGPMWTAVSFKLDTFESIGGDYDKKHKLVYDAKGGMIAIGIEENSIFKEMHPVFIEISYSYSKSHKVSTVDTSTFIETNILTEEERNQDLNMHSLMFSLGMTIF